MVSWDSLGFERKLPLGQDLQELRAHRPGGAHDGYVLGHVLTVQSPFHDPAGRYAGPAHTQDRK